MKDVFEKTRDVPTHGVKNGLVDNYQFSNIILFLKWKARRPFLRLSESER